jgi:hypothetical protein
MEVGGYVHLRRTRVHPPYELLIWEYGRRVSLSRGVYPALVAGLFTVMGDFIPAILYEIFITLK